VTSRAGVTQFLKTSPEWGEIIRRFINNEVTRGMDSAFVTRILMGDWCGRPTLKPNETAARTWLIRPCTAKAAGRLPDTRLG